MNTLTPKQNLTIDSREVAQMLEIEHSDLLKKLEGTEKIIGIIPTLRKGNFTVSEYFIESAYKVDGNNKSYKNYLFTKMGCEFIANKFTGEKGILFTAKYVERFNQMEQSQQPQNNMKIISMLHEEIGQLINESSNHGERIFKLENTMTIDYSQQETLRALANSAVIKALGYRTPAYKELNKKAFSSMWKDYKRALGVNSYRNTAVKDFEKAKEFLSNWKPERELGLMIKGANAQEAV